MNKEEKIKSIMFILYSFASGALELIFFLLLDNLTTFDFWISYSIALFFSTIFNYLFNHEFVFVNKRFNSFAIIEKILFYMFFWPVTAILGQYLVEGLAYNSIFIFYICMLSNFFLEYAYDKYLLFEEE